MVGGYDNYSEAKGLLDKAKRVVANRGIKKFISYFFEYVYHNTKLRKNIYYKDKRFKVYRSLKNHLTPWRGEREAELPVFLDILNSSKAKSVLEVGNVMRNYYPSLNIPVLDKYEVGRGIINEDVIDFNPSKRYDLILSISTLEHVGWDESPKVPVNVIKGINNLKRLLNKGGVLVFSFAWGANSYLEEAILNKRIKFSYKSFIIKTKKGWKESDFDYWINQKTLKKPFHDICFIGYITK